MDTVLWRARSHVLSVHNTILCIPSCVYSLLERLCSSELMLCFHIGTLHIHVWFIDRLFSTKKQALKQNLAELLCFCGKLSCFSNGKQMILIVSGEEDGIHLTSLFSAYSFMPLEFCTVYMYYLLFKKNSCKSTVLQ